LNCDHKNGPKATQKWALAVVEKQRPKGLRIDGFGHRLALKDLLARALIAIHRSSQMAIAAIPIRPFWTEP
jgi:hypothetical protein